MVRPRARVMVVDDDPDACSSVAAILRSVEIDALEVSTAAKVDVALRSFSPDVLLLDVNLDQGASGIDIAAAIRERDAAADLPVIFMSAWSRDEQTVARALATGGSDFIRRPFGSEELLARVDVALRHRRARLALLRAALTDALTTLPNRGAFDAALERERARAVRSGLPLSLLAIDVDGFKKINDAWGHAAGDRVLVAIASVLRRNCRETDVVCRVGGEEFAVILFATGAAGASRVAAKLRDAVRAMAVVLDDARRIPVTASFGAATGSAESLAAAGDAAALFARADAALYVAKDAGRDRVAHADDARQPPRR